MRHKSKTILAALFAVFAFAAVASASASAALPEFVPSSGGFPITIEASYNTIHAAIENASPGWSGSCEGLKTKGDITGSKALSLTIELEKCAIEGQRCETVGLEGGHETLSGSASLVYISKASKQVGILFTLTPTEFLCGAVKEKLRGTILIPVTPINTKTSSLGFLIEGSKGIPKFKNYENEKGELKSAKLELNVGSGYLGADLEIGGELKLTTSKSLTVSG